MTQRITFPISTHIGYLQRTAFGGKVSGRNFGVAADRPGRFDLTRLVLMLEDLHTRLAGVVIECLDFEDFIRRYDKPTTFFYLDPPYWGSESDYGKERFSRDGFGRLEDCLKSLKGRFLMSVNDRPEVREMFTGFEMISVDTTYSVAQISADRQRKASAELLIKRA